jgi:hypothetical protein
VTGTSGNLDTLALDYATIKYNSAGQQLWVARYDGPAHDYDGAAGIAVDNSGNVCVTGYSPGSGTVDDYATIKYNSAGQQQWVARYNGPGNWEDIATAIAVSDSGNVYVTGSSTGSPVVAGIGYDYATIRYNSAGQQQWVARYNGPGYAEDSPNAIAVDRSDNVYVTGRSCRINSVYSFDYATLKYNSAGQQQWIARYNGPGDGPDEAWAIAVDGSGNVYVTGRSPGSGTGDDYATVKYVSPPTDFNNDGKTDYLLYNAGTRQTVVWYLNNNVRIGGAYGPTLPVGWRVIDVADFNRDGKPDYALFNAGTRQTAIWYLSGVMFIGSANGPTPPTGWALAATGDFNNDGKPDYVLNNASTRQTFVWYLNNNVFIGGANGPTLPAGWSLAGIADFNRDGKSDYLLFNPTTHNSVIWYLSGTVRIGSAFGPTIAAGYNLSGTADFNRDGKPDYLLFNPSTRQTVIWYLNNNVRTGTAYGPTLLPGWTLAAP